MPEILVDDKLRCTICLAATRTIALLPCYHLILCKECFVRIHQSGMTQRRCPLCRSYYENLMIVKYIDDQRIRGLNEAQF